MAGTFVPISPSKYPLLLTTLENRLPNSAKVWNIVKLKEGNRFSEKVNTTILAFEDNVDESGLIVAMQHGKYAVGEEIAVSLSGPTTMPLIESLTSKLIDAFEKAMNWKLPNCFCAVDDNLIKQLKLDEMCSRNGLLQSIDPNYMYQFPIVDALKLNVGDSGTRDESGMTISTLSKEDAQTVTDYWKFSGPGTLERMEDVIQCIGSAGVYVDSPEGKKLASWVVTSHSGSINALFTHPDHRRKGYGKLTMEAMTRWAAKDGLVPNVQIQLSNNASKLLMEQLGYLYSHRISWVVYKPKV